MKSFAEHPTLEDWIAREAIPFAIDSSTSFDATIDRIVMSLGNDLDLLGFGEALHGGEEILNLRNRLFQRLVEAHGYSAIAVESSFPRGRVANDYLTGGNITSDEAYETGFSHGFGNLAANHELVEWMRQFNASLESISSQRLKLHFYGFDQPAVTAGPASPRQVLNFALDYIASIDAALADQRRGRIESLIGPDAPWENPMVWRDPVQSAEMLVALASLRIETEELISELHVHRAEWMAISGKSPYTEAMHYASMARQLLNFFAAMAGSSDFAASLGVRDAAMADNLAYIVERERVRGHGGGKVLAFAHNKHLQRGQARWPIGSNSCAWWPAGAHLRIMFGRRYAVIGTAVGVSDQNGIGQPEPGTLEALLTAAPGPARFVPTRYGQGLPAATIAAIPTRTGNVKNPSYFPLDRKTFTDFDGLIMLDSVTYNRGGRPLPS